MIEKPLEQIQQEAWRACGSPSRDINCIICENCVDSDQEITLAHVFLAIKKDGDFCGIFVEGLEITNITSVQVSRYNHERFCPPKHLCDFFWDLTKNFNEQFDKTQRAVHELLMRGEQ